MKIADVIEEPFALSLGVVFCIIYIALVTVQHSRRIDIFAREVIKLFRKLCRSFEMLKSLLLIIMASEIESCDLEVSVLRTAGKEAVEPVVKIEFHDFEIELVASKIPLVALTLAQTHLGSADEVEIIEKHRSVDSRSIFSLGEMVSSNNLSSSAL